MWLGSSEKGVMTIEVEFDIMFMCHNIIFLLIFQTL